MTYIREDDPAKRVELHAARTMLLSSESLLSFARFSAERGGDLDARAHIEEAQDRLNQASDPPNPWEGYKACLRDRRGEGGEAMRRKP